MMFDLKILQFSKPRTGRVSTPPERRNTTSVRRKYLDTEGMAEPSYSATVGNQGKSVCGGILRVLSQGWRLRKEYEAG